ncbi:hypothetical protein FRC01_004463 [Tulasnella sp. 417]|nr:hypothetical protein FRC01_004463 [Tulasnella sp. 417]
MVDLMSRGMMRVSAGLCFQIENEWHKNEGILLWMGLVPLAAGSLAKGITPAGRGPGVGCPAASTTLNARRKALQDQLASGNTNIPAPAVTPVTTTSTTVPAATTTPAAADSNDFRAQVAALAPELGFESGVNPDGTGNCDGAIPGGPKIPCQCPPPRDEFISQLQDNAVAGKAVHNPDVKVDFPLDDSVASKKSRIIASLITIQNLRGPGVGCPAVSTTLSQQLEALG